MAKELRFVFALVINKYSLSMFPIVLATWVEKKNKPSASDSFFYWRVWK